MSIQMTYFDLIDYEVFQILKKWEINSIKIKLNKSINFFLLIIFDKEFIYSNLNWKR